MELRIFVVTVVCVFSLVAPTIGTYEVTEVLDDSFVVDKQVVTSGSVSTGAVTFDNSAIKDTLLQALLNHRRQRLISCSTLCRVSRCPSQCIPFCRPQRFSLIAGVGNLLAAKAAAVKNVVSSVVSNTAAVVSNALNLKSQALLLGAKTVSDILSNTASIVDSTLVQPQIQPNLQVVVKPNVQFVMSKPVPQKIIERPIIVQPYKEKPVEYKPIDLKPIVLKPDEIKPLEWKPVVLKPDEYKPIEWKPIVLKPDEFKPIELKPIKVPGQTDKYEIVVTPNWPLLISKYPELFPGLTPMSEKPSQNVLELVTSVANLTVPPLVLSGNSNQSPNLVEILSPIQANVTVPGLVSLSEKPQNPSILEILSPLQANMTVPVLTSTGNSQNPLLLEILSPQQANLTVLDKLSLLGTPVYTTEDKSKPLIGIRL